jgi:protein TonB
MSNGINTNVEFRGEVYHVQTEDGGRDRPMLKTVVFIDGVAVATVETSYAKLAGSEDFSEKEVARRLTAQHWKAAADLRMGRLYLDADRRVQPSGASTPVETKEEKKEEDDNEDEPQDEVPTPSPPTDRRVVMLAMALAVVSVMLAVLTVLSLLPSSGHSRFRASDVPMAAGEPARQSVPAQRFEPADEPAVCAVLTTDHDARTPDEPATFTGKARPRRGSTPVRTPSADKAAPPVPPSTSREESRPSPTAAAQLPPRTAAPKPERQPAARPEPAAPPTESAPEPVARRLPPPTPVPPVESDLSSRLPVEPEMETETAVGGPYLLADVDVAPRLTSQEMPIYTKRARRKKQQGTVELNLMVDERGVVTDLRLKKTIPDSDLNEAVIDSVRGWRFDPARKGGVAVRVWKPVTVEFSIVAGQRRVRFLER